MDTSIHILTWSTNSGRYCLDDPETGHDVTSGESLAIQVLNGLWVEGRVEHSSGGYNVGCYAIADTGRRRREARPNQMQTEGDVKQAVYGAMEGGASLEDAISAVTPQITDLFYGYYFLTVDGQAIGLCTGMRVQQR